MKNSCIKIAKNLQKTPFKPTIKNTPKINEELASLKKTVADHSSGQNINQQ